MIFILIGAEGAQELLASQVPWARRATNEEEKCHLNALERAGVDVHDLLVDGTGRPYFGFLIDREKCPEKVKHKLEKHLRVRYLED